MSTANDSILTMLGYGGGSASYNTVNGAGAPDDAASAERLRLSVPITCDQLEAASRTGVYQQLAARLITAALSELPTVSVGGDVDQGERLQDRLSELGAWTQTKIAACAAERWGVAGLLIRTSSPGTDLERPLSFPGDGKIIELLPITRGEMRPIGWVHEMWSPNFLQPRLIEIRLQLPDGIGHATRVHPSRVILFRGPRQDGTMIDATSVGDGWDKYGLPLLDRLRSVLPLLLVLDRETSRQVQQQGVVVRTLSADGAAMMMDREGVSGLEAGIAYASRVLSSAGQQVLLPGETLERLSSGSEVWDKVELAVYHLACLALGWPLELVNGQPPPGLGDSGKGAQLSFRPLVEGVQREKLAIPAMEMCRVVLTELGLPDARPNVVFGDPLSPTPAERANIRLQHTQSDALAVQAGIMPAEYFAQRYTSADGWREDLEPYVPDVAPIEGMPTTTAEGEAAPVATATEPKEPIPVGYASTMLQLVAEHALHPERAAQYRGMLAAMGIGPDVAAVILPDVAPAPAAPAAEPTLTGDAEESYTPPKGAQQNAAKVLRWRDEHGDEVKGMTPVGWTRANQLAKGEPLSRKTIGRMAAFERHRQNSKIAPENEGTPWKDAGYVAWLGWGGDEGVAWAQGILDREDA